MEDNVSPGEREEIQEILGVTLVEESLDLQNEVSTLVDIWRDYRDDIEAELPMAPVLPEPPMVRESLCNHIRLLLESLTDKAKEEGRDSGISLSKHNGDVLDYVMEDSGSRGCSPTVNNNRRPCTAMSIRDGRDTPMRMTPCSDSDMLSATSSASDQVESVRDQLNILKIDEVVLELRATLQDEVDQLKRDISFLHRCLEEESDFRAQSSIISEPSLQDLRTERSQLQKELLTTSQPSSLSIIQAVKTSGRALPKTPLKRFPIPLSPSKTTRGSSPKLRPSPPTILPVKVFHGLNHHHPTTGNSATSRLSSINNGGDAADKGPSHKPSNRSSTLSSATSSHANITNRTVDHHNRQINPASSRGTGSPTSGILRPSPPPNAKPPPGKPGSTSRFRTRIRDVKQGATT